MNELLVCNEMSVSSLITEHRGYQAKLKDFKKAVDDYMRFYNEERPHQTLAYKSPNRFEELYGRKNDK